MPVIRLTLAVATIGIMFRLMPNINLSWRSSTANARKRTPNCWCKKRQESWNISLRVWLRVMNTSRTSPRYWRHSATNGFRSEQENVDAPSARLIDRSQDWFMQRFTRHEWRGESKKSTIGQCLAQRSKWSRHWRSRNVVGRSILPLSSGTMGRTETVVAERYESRTAFQRIGTCIGRQRVWACTVITSAGRYEHCGDPMEKRENVPRQWRRDSPSTSGL